MKNRNIYTYLKLKRFLDFVFSLFLLFFLFPLFIIVSIAIKLDSKGPVIFKQYRLGKNGKKFKMYKFRSMVVDSEKKNLPLTTMPNDSRITNFGKLLRITSIDELPQLINVLKGDMSLIGPRPIRVPKYEDFSDEQKRRFEVKPGITGLAQINGRKSLDLDKKCEYDIQYVDSICFRLDLKIFFSTFLVLTKNNY